MWLRLALHLDQSHIIIDDPCRAAEYILVLYVTAAPRSLVAELSERSDCRISRFPLLSVILLYSSQNYNCVYKICDRGITAGVSASLQENLTSKRVRYGI